MMGPMVLMRSESRGFGLTDNTMIRQCGGPCRIYRHFFEVAFWEGKGDAYSHGGPINLGGGFLPWLND
jgi:hypothetical protein